MELLKLVNKHLQNELCKMIFKQELGEVSVINTRQIKCGKKMG
jgi:hypothetical protein